MVKHIDAKSTDMGGNRPRAADLSSVLPPNPCFIKIFTILGPFVRTHLNNGSSKWKIKEQQIPHPPPPPLGHDWLSSRRNSKRDLRSDNELEWLSRCRSSELYKGRYFIETTSNAGGWPLLCGLATPKNLRCNHCYDFSL